MSAQSRIRFTRKATLLAAAAGRRLFKGPNVKKFLDWFEQLEVGSAIR